MPPALPKAIGPYQAVRAGNVSGQIGLDPGTAPLVDGTEAQAHRVCRNLRAVAEAAGGKLDDITKLAILLVDLAEFAQVNEIMATHFTAPYPARVIHQVAGLPRGARIEVDAVLGPGRSPPPVPSRRALPRYAPD